MYFSHGESVTVLRAVAGADGYGDPVLADWANTGSIVSTAVQGCAVAPSSGANLSGTSAEDNNNRTAVIVGLQLYLPAGTDIRSSDRVVVRGETFEVEGIPGDWRSPFTGWRPGVEVALIKVSG